MADFRQQLQSFYPSQAFTYTDMNSIMLENFNFADFLADTFLNHQQQPKYPSNNTQFPRTSHAISVNAFPVLQHMATGSNTAEASYESRDSLNLPSMASGSRLKVNNDARKKISPGKGKKRMENGIKEDGAEKVIQVKARRGQATDKHSLAERVRREKINSKLKRLQILVPGCYKTMGMAAMLDEIINYVHSLQHQVEFLSTELAAASSSYIYNMEAEGSSGSAGDKIQMRQGSW
ncbi:hypothetical protein NMG60_11028586 [Bertholletia excelsa]